MIIYANSYIEPDYQNIIALELKRSKKILTNTTLIVTNEFPAFAGNFAANKYYTMVRDRIIKEAETLFDAYGIKAVSMDNIASGLNISKKTIYKNFRSKRELVFEVVRTGVEKGMEALAKAEKLASSPLENIILINIITLGQVINHCPAFFRDLEAYPEAMLKIYDQYVSLVRAKYVRFFFRCIEERLFAPDADLHIVIDYFMEQARITSEKHYADGNDKRGKHIQTAIAFLAGICTDMGRTELARLKSVQFLSKK